jgi:hypothetical protein
MYERYHALSDGKHVELIRLEQRTRISTTFGKSVVDGASSIELEKKPKAWFN